VAAPASRILAPGQDRPTLRLRLREGPYRPAAVTCYASGQGRIPAQWDPSAGILSVTPRAPLPPGRSRYNCTAPVRGEPGAYFWYSHLWLKKRPDGHWYRE
jgi:hypothetical protein